MSAAPEQNPNILLSELDRGLYCSVDGNGSLFVTKKKIAKALDAKLRQIEFLIRKFKTKAHGYVKREAVYPIEIVPVHKALLPAHRGPLKRFIRLKLDCKDCGSKKEIWNGEVELACWLLENYYRQYPDADKSNSTIH